MEAAQILIDLGLLDEPEDDLCKPPQEEAAPPTIDDEEPGEGRYPDFRGSRVEVLSRAKWTREEAEQEFARRTEERGWRPLEPMFWDARWWCLRVAN